MARAAPPRHYFYQRTLEDHAKSAYHQKALVGFRGALPPERVSAIERAAVADAAAEPVSAGAASAGAEPAPAAQSEPRPEAARGRHLSPRRQRERTSAAEAEAAGGARFSG